MIQNLESKILEEVQNTKTGHKHTGSFDQKHQTDQLNYKQRCRNDKPLVGAKPLYSMTLHTLGQYLYMLKFISAQSSYRPQLYAHLKALFASIAGSSNCIR